MYKVLIVGAGAQGGPCASILARDKDVSEIVLSDIDLDLAKKVSKKINSDKITVTKLDAGNIDDVEKAAKGADVIINLTVTAYDMNIMEAALRNGIHYVDTSFGEPSLLDIRAKDNILAQIIEKRPISFDKEYKDSGITGLVGCGSLPGTVNVVARYVCDKLDQVNEIRIRMGGRSFEPKKSVASAWEPTWSPFRALWGYAVEPTMFVNGQYKKFPIFSEPEEYPFPEPVGPVLLTYHQHQEPITLPHFIGKGIKYCDFKYPVDTLAGAFVKMGLASPDPINVKGIKVVPRDVVLALTRPPVNTFLAEDENTAKQPLTRIGYTLVEVKGIQSGEEVKYTAYYPSGFSMTPEEKLAIFKKLGTNIIGVALPAVIGAKMCLKGDADRGVIAPECLDPKEFFKNMTDMGVPVKLTEVITKETRFSTSRKK